MQKRSLIVLAVLFVALLAYVLLVEVGRQDEREQREALDKQVLAIEADAVRRVRIERGSAPAVEIELRGEAGAGEWFLVAPFEAPADPAAARGLARAAATLEERRLLEQTAEDVSQYGLEPPALVVTLEADGLDGARTLTFGGETGSKDGRYVQLDGDEQLRIAPSYQFRSLDKTVDDLRDRRLVRFSTGDATEVVLARGEQVVELRREDGVWRLPGLDGARADRAEVDDLLADLTTTRAKRFVDADDPTLGLADSDRAIRVTLADASVIQVDFGREDAETVIAQLRGSDEALELSSMLARPLERAASDWRSTEVADINPWQVSRLVFDHGGRAFDLVRDDDEAWTLAEGDQPASELTAERARELLATIDQLRGSGWLDADEDPGPQVGAYEVTTEGTPLVRFTLHRSGDRWVARVDGDPAPMIVDDSLGLFVEGFLADPTGSGE